MTNPPVVAALALVILFAVAGCSRKTDANSQLERAVAEMQTVPPAQTAQPAGQTPQTPAQQVNQALTSYKGGDYNGAVTQLRTMLSQGSTGKIPMTPQQYMALQDAAGAVLNDLRIRAANGDTRAQQAVKEYERLRRVP